MNAVLRPIGVPLTYPSRHPIKCTQRCWRQKWLIKASRSLQIVAGQFSTQDVGRCMLTKLRKIQRDACMKIILLFLCSFIPLAAIAGPSSGAFLIATIHIENGDVYVKSTSTLPDPLSCGINTMVKLNKDDIGFKELYSMALTAYASNKKVRFWLKSCDFAPWAGNVAKAYADQFAS